MGGYGSQAFLGQEVGPDGPVRPVVMVFLPDEVVEDADTFEKILAETKVAVRLDHKNVISVHGLVRLDEGYARIVEFADAESIRFMLRRSSSLHRRISPPVACSVLANACMGVHYAHELGQGLSGQPLIHGGIRPETLLVSFSGITKVTGYGASLIAAASARARGAESSIRDAYTAPEQIMDGRDAAVLQTDVYALGAVLYEALSGKPPFGMDASLASAITTAIPNEQLLADVPENLAKIVLKAMAKTPQERFSSALEMRQALLDVGVPAFEQEVALFMEELFPADMPQRLARNQLLEQGKVDDDPNTTAAALDPEAFTEQTPRDPIELGEQPATDPEAGPPPAAMAAAAAGQLPATPPPAVAAPPASPVAPPPAAAYPAAPQPPPVGPGAFTAAQSVEYAAGYHTQPSAEHAAQVFQGQPPGQPPSAFAQGPVPSGQFVQGFQQGPVHSSEFPSQPPRTVYKTHPALYIGLILVGAVVLVLGTVMYMRSQEPQQPVPPVQPVVATPTPPPVVPDAGQVKPDAAEPKPEPVKTAAVSKKKKKKKKKKIGRRPPPPPSEDDGFIGSGGSGNTGLLVIDAPGGSAISVDGKPRGKSPISPLTLKAGTHRVVVTQTGTGVQYRKTVKVRAGLDLTMTVYFHND